jgi:cell division septum initiation protein DivIVA
VKENKRIINQQEMEALEAKRKRLKASSTDFKDSSSSSSSSSEEESSSSSEEKEEAPNKKHKIAERRHSNAGEGP